MRIAFDTQADLAEGDCRGLPLGSSGDIEPALSAAQAEPAPRPILTRRTETKKATSKSARANRRDVRKGPHSRLRPAPQRITYFSRECSAVGLTTSVNERAAGRPTPWIANLAPEFPGLSRRNRPQGVWSPSQRWPGNYFRMRATARS